MLNMKQHVTDPLTNILHHVSTTIKDVQSPDEGIDASLVQKGVVLLHLEFGEVYGKVTICRRV